MLLCACQNSIHWRLLFAQEVVTLYHSHAKCQGRAAVGTRSPQGLGRTWTPARAAFSARASERIDQSRNGRERAIVRGASRSEREAAPSRVGDIPTVQRADSPLALSSRRSCSAAVCRATLTR